VIVCGEEYYSIFLSESICGSKYVENIFEYRFAQQRANLLGVILSERLSIKQGNIFRGENIPKI
jgi:hypothetical protein